jgi:hypothetical protein
LVLKRKPYKIKTRYNLALPAAAKSRAAEEPVRHNINLFDMKSYVLHEIGDALIGLTYKSP